MYYRNDGFGCGCLVLLLLMMATFALIFNPYFWVAVGIIALISVIKRAIDGTGNNRQNGPQNGGFGGYNGNGYNGQQNGGQTAYNQQNQQGGWQNQNYQAQQNQQSYRPQEPIALEDDYETGAVDVDVEVIPDDESWE